MVSDPDRPTQLAELQPAGVLHFHGTRHYHSKCHVGLPTPLGQPRCCQLMRLVGVGTSTSEVWRLHAFLLADQRGLSVLQRSLPQHRRCGEAVDCVLLTHSRVVSKCSDGRSRLAAGRPAECGCGGPCHPRGRPGGGSGCSGRARCCHNKVVPQEGWPGGDVQGSPGQQDCQTARNSVHVPPAPPISSPCAARCMRNPKVVSHASPEKRSEAPMPREDSQPGHVSDRVAASENNFDCLPEIGIEHS